MFILSHSESSKRMSEQAPLSISSEIAPSGGTCNQCDAAEARFRCGFCKLAFYCDAVCQRKHFKAHKKQRPSIANKETKAKTTAPEKTIEFDSLENQGHFKSKIFIKYFFINFKSNN